MSTGAYESFRQSTNVLPPVLSGILVASVTTTTSSIDISSISQKASYITIQADGDDIYFAFGSASSSGITLDPTAVAGAGVCFKLPNGASADFKMEAIANVHDKLWVKASTTTCKIRIYQSSQRRVGNP